MNSDWNCDQCVALMINGTYCHETGCPNTHKVKVDDEWRGRKLAHHMTALRATALDDMSKTLREELETILALVRGTRLMATFLGEPDSNLNGQKQSIDLSLKDITMRLKRLIKEPGPLTDEIKR